MFVMQQIPHSNLLLLVTDSTCDCSVFPQVLQEAIQIKYILAVPQGAPSTPASRPPPQGILSVQLPGPGSHLQGSWAHQGSVLPELGLLCLQNQLLP